MESQIKANAELVIRQLGLLSDIVFGYNEQSVAWVDGFIEQQRSRPELDQKAVQGLVNVLGSFLGECIIHCFGGQWREMNSEWCIAFDDQNAVYPFNKVSKQFSHGADDSIKHFFATIPVLFGPHLPKPKPAATAAELEQLERFVRQAAEAYDRLYEEWSHSDRAAAYNECKESLAEAIRLARRLGLDAQVAELEKKREHYKNVFQHQMNF
jgi:hypothetical protein